jgi:periplasmic protein TonB
MKCLLTLILFACSLVSFGQDTTYYGKGDNQVTELDQATYYEVVLKDPTDANKAFVKSYDVSGKQKSEAHYVDYEKKKQDGKYMDWYKNGQLHTVIDFKDGMMHGQVLTFWENGQPKRNDNYENGKFIDGTCMTSAGEDTLHFDYEIMPEYPGGIDALMKFLSGEIKYPRQSRKDGITGRVIVGFIVNADGTISDVKIVRSISDELDQESLRVVKSMRPWAPGMQDGMPVRVQFNLPVGFYLK